CAPDALYRRPSAAVLPLPGGRRSASLGRPRRLSLTPSPGAPMSTRAARALLAAALLAGCAAGQARAPAPDAAKTPEDFARLFAEAEKAAARVEDIDTLLAAYTPWLAAPSRELVGDFTGVLKAYRPYSAALDARFGKGPNEPPDPFLPRPGARPELKPVEIKG